MNIDEVLEYINDRIIPNEKWDYVSNYLINAREEIERLTKENEELTKIQCIFLGTGCKAKIESLRSIIKDTIKDLEVVKEVEDLEVIKMSLRNIIFRLNKENKYVDINSKE